MDMMPEHDPSDQALQDAATLAEARAILSDAGRLRLAKSAAKAVSAAARELSLDKSDDRDRADDDDEADEAA